MCASSQALAALGGAEGEEVLENAAVRDHPRDQRNKHQHGGYAHHPAAFEGPAPLLRGAQLEVEAVEEVAAHGLARVDGLAGLRVHAQRLEAAIARVAPQDVDGKVAVVGQVHDPLRDVGHPAHQRVQGFLRYLRIGGIHRLQSMHLGAHPQVELVLEERQRAGQEDCK